MANKISKKEKEFKKKQDLSILLALIFGMFGFFGSYTAKLELPMPWSFKKL